MKKYYLLKITAKTLTIKTRIYRNIDVYLYVKSQYADVFENYRFSSANFKADDNGKLHIDFDIENMEKAEKIRNDSMANEIDNSIIAWNLFKIDSDTSNFFNIIDFSELEWSELTTIPEFSYISHSNLLQLKNNKNIQLDQCVASLNLNSYNLYRFKPTDESINANYLLLSNNF